MIAFDTDVLNELLRGNPNYARRVTAVPLDQQFVPIVVVEEILRGRLNMVRRSEAGKTTMTIERAYELFEESVKDAQRLRILSYSADAQQQFQAWRQQKIRVATHDLRIAATCVAHGARLVSRNRRDFELIPGLSVDFWN